MAKIGAHNVDITPGGAVTSTFPSASGTLALSYPYGIGVTGTNTAQSLPNATNTTVAFNTKTWDLSTEFNTTTFTYTALTAGYYQVNATVYFSTPATGSFCLVGIVVNGSFVISSSGVPGGGNDFAQPVSGIIKLAIGDTVLIQAYQNSGLSKTLYVPNCRFSLQRLF